MTAAGETPPGDEPGPEEGVFGRLPSARPGMRSPRRREQPTEPAMPEAAGTPDPAPAADEPGPPPDDTPPPPFDPPADAEAGEDEPEDGDEDRVESLEDLAWIAIIAAAKAATAAVRFATKTMESTGRSAGGSE